VFPDTGLYEVTLLITHPQGCIDSLTRLIDVLPEIYYYLPNAFTPNSDDLNDLFLGAGYMRGATMFRMDIWNRWGELVYWSESPDEGWNGQRRNDGRLSPPGQYFYRVNFVGPRGKPFSFEGWVTLMN
jgi:gliding motility-associated-like protein